MKKFLIYFALSIIQISQAQTTNWDLALSQIGTNTSGFSSQKILLDKVASFADLYNYNYIENNTSSANHFKQSLSELYYASNSQYFNNRSNYPNFDAVITNATDIPIGIINTKCSYLNYDEDNNINGNLQFVNGIFTPIRTSEPYFIEKELSVISPLFPSFVSDSNSFVFKFDESQIYQYGNSINKLEVNFGDGIWRLVIQNSIMVQNTHTVNLNITTIQKQLISFKIIQNSGKQLTTHAEILLSKKIINAEIFKSGVCAVSSLLKNRSTIADSQNIKGEIEYKIFYGDQNNTCTVKKPVIIVDGFDPGDKRRIDFNDCQNDPRCIAANPEATLENYNSLNKLMRYGTTSLKDVMNAENYDVILVNFPYYNKIQNNPNLGEICAGADDITRNAYSIASFIQKINADLITNGSSEKLVIVGPSMGGLITRYALAYLEKQGIAHNTKLWVSMDSPHQGANIPLAVQQDIFFFAKKLKQSNADEQFNNLLHSIAAEQILIDIVDYNGNNTRNITNINFTNNMRNNGVANSEGFPVLDGIRKIAISNGSFAGINNVTPKENFFHIKASAKIRLFGIRVGRKRIFRVNNYYTPNMGENVMLVDNQGRNPDENVGNTNYSMTYTGFNSNGSMDSVPGGNTNAANDLKDEVNLGLVGTNARTNILGIFLGTFRNLIIDKIIPTEINTIISPQSFIPTHSSLDTKNFSNWYQPINKNIVCTNQTPFNSYYGEVNNSGHITFSTNMVNWLLKELKGQPQAPNFPIQENAMSGPDFVCSTTTYSFPDICKIPSSVTWSWSSNLQVVSQSAYSINVSKVSDGPGFIKATFQNGQTLTKTIWVGVPKFNNLQPIGSQYGYDSSEPNLSVSPDGDGCNQIRLNAVFDSPNILEYQWEKITTSVAWSVSPNSGYIYIYPQCNQNFSFKVRTRNICGWSEWKEFEYALNRCTIDCNTSTPIINTGLNFILNPNPVTNDILNINVKYNAPWFIIPVNIGNGNNFDITNEFGESNYQLIPNISVNITIFNQLGVPVLQFPNTSVHPTPAELDVSSLQAGTYMVVFEYQGQVESYTIIKN